MTADVVAFPFPVEKMIGRIAEADAATLNHFVEILESKAAVSQMSPTQLWRIWDPLVRRSQQLRS